MKRKYEKPSMTVYELTGKPQILVGSDRYPGEFGYIPSGDEKHLA